MHCVTVIVGKRAAGKSVAAIKVVRASTHQKMSLEHSSGIPGPVACHPTVVSPWRPASQPRGRALRASLALWVESVVSLCVCRSVWPWDSRSVTVCAPRVRLCALPGCVDSTKRKENQFNQLQSPTLLPLSTCDSACGSARLEPGLALSAHTKSNSSARRTRSVRWSTPTRVSSDVDPR